MGECRLRQAVGLLISVNLLMLVLRSTLEPSTSLSVRRLDGQNFSGGTRRTEPYIVPRVGSGKDFSGEFSRTRWSDVFSPGGKEGAQFWESKRPKNYTGKPDFVLAIPTVPREGDVYLFNTLHSLIDNMNGYKSVVVVILVGDEDDASFERITSVVKANFSSQYSEGLIQVIHPPKGYYPDWKVQLRQSFDDTFERVKWRSKQNVDQVYLMMYSYVLQPKYYLMLEDDILAASDYLAKIYLDAESKADRNFVLINYCQLGAIGKLFRAELLPSLASYISLFWSDKPLDWLIPNYVSGRVCGPNDKSKDCGEKVKSVSIFHKPSLFQHIGTKSSFPGKIQKLQDKLFKP